MVLLLVLDQTVMGNKLARFFVENSALSLAKRWGIAPLGDFHENRIVKAFGLVVLMELRTQTAGFCADNRVNLRVERGGPLVDLHANQVLVELAAVSSDLLLHHKAQKSSQPFRLHQRPARKNLLELLWNLSKMRKFVELRRPNDRPMLDTEGSAGCGQRGVVGSGVGRATQL
jgi:hypothetical protein